MTKEDEPTYRIVINAKGARARRVVEFMAEQVDGLEIVENGALGIEVKENGQTWEQELAELSGLIDKTNEELSVSNPVTIAGFRRIYGEREEYLTKNKAYFSDIYQFADSVIDVFKQSYEQYSARSERPQVTGKRSNAYLRIGNYLTPREIRLIIRGRGLAGEIMKPEKVGELEGFSANNPHSGRGAINRAQQKLIYILTPSTAKYAPYQARYNSRYGQA